MPIVARLKEVRKVYDLGEVKVEALRGVDLDFEEGDFCAIMGSSGSGKSTLLNILGCLDRPSSGAYFLGDQNVADLDDDALSEIRGQRLGFIFQSYNLIQQLTVVENIEVPLFYQGMDTPAMREYCIALATRLGLGERLDHRPMQLSGGQQQRVAIARALVNDPFVVLADEATGNLDTKTSDEIMALLCQLNESGKTILMVTHEDDIAQFAKRIVRMRDGQVVEDEINHTRRNQRQPKRDDFNMSKHRVVIVGMDGCTQQILQPLIKEGKLPTLAKLQREGVAGKLWSVVPPITPAAWSSFYTGKLPGKHGVFEFLYRKPDSYEKAPVNSHSIRAKKWWEYANEAGLKTCLFNLPLLYPTKPVNGVAVSGMLTPESARDFGKPDGIVEEIERAVGKPYVIATNAVYRKGEAGKVLDELHRVLDYHMKAGLHLFKKDRWDVFFCHLLQTDSMQHELWHLLDPTHSAHDPEEWNQHRDRIEAIYTRIDREFLAPMVESLDDDTTLLVMSDHGFGGIEHIIYMNLWLLQKGYIQWSTDWWTRTKSWLHRRGVTPRNMFKFLRAVGLGGVRDKMDLANREKWMNRGFMNLRRADWSKTRAYSMGNILGMIYLNVKGREPHGCVEPGEEYDRLREQLISELKAERIPNTDQPLFAKVEKGEDIFSGVYQPSGPDIVCTPTDWRYQVFGYQDFVSNKFIESYMEMTGHHRPDGIVFGLGSKLAKGKWVEDCRLVDMGPTILHLVGLPIPTDMDGVPLEQMFDDDAWEYPQMLPVEEAREAVAAVELSEDEQRLVMQRLKALGYEDGL